MLLTPTRMTNPNAPEPLIEPLKQQLAELDALIAQGVLKGQAAQNQREALEGQVLAALAGPAAKAEQALQAVPPRVPRKLLAKVALFVLVFGGVGYAWQGNREGFKVGPGENVAVAQTDVGAGQPAPTQAQIDEMVQRLAERLKDKPDDAKGWSMLARSYSAQGKIDQALPAYKRVLDLRPNDAQAMVDYADALAVVNNRSLDGEPEQLVMRAVQVDPVNVKALSLAGTVAFNKAQYPQAVSFWERAVQAADPQSGFATQLQGALDEARKRAGLPAAPAAVAPAAVAPAIVAPAAAAAAGDGSPNAASPGAATVSGRVTLKAALKDKVSADDTVFIFARAATGPRMPLAILRKKASDLPLDFSLDDSMAMSPATRLSTATQVVVGARISKSGNAMPQAGDLQGFSAPVALGATALAIEIGDAVP
jgi:cytochrome c-type biogenesis protein CcmH